MMKTSTLVKHLLQQADWLDEWDGNEAALLREAADKLEKLKKRLKQVEKANQPKEL